MTTNSNPPLQPIKIAGSGALGSLFAAFLEPHSDVSMLSHWMEQIETVRSQGLICVHRNGSSSKHQFLITNNARDLEPIQLALVLVKSYQTARTAFELAPILAANGLVITLQNGLGNYEMLEAALGHGRVVQGVSAQGATMLGPGRVRHAGHGLTHIATTPGKELILNDFVRLLNHAGLAAQSTEDVKSLQWGKLAVNTGINPLTAILRVRNGFLVKNESAREVMCAAAEETAAVAHELGISLPFTDAAARVTEVAEATAENFSSMLQDVLRGAPTEIDAINGAVASHAQQIDMPAPVNEALWRQVKAIQATSQTDAEIDREKLLKKLLGEMT